MVVQQEMAEIYPPDAEELSELLPETDCGRCGFASCIEFAEALIERRARTSICPDLGSEFAEILGAILKINKDPIPYNIMMEQEPCTLIEINNPDKGSPVLVTSNFRETVRIMKEILGSTGTSAFLLPTFTHGYSVDNAVHERMFKATEIWKALKENAIEQRVSRTVMVIPGLANKEKNPIRQLTGWDVLVGPVSGFLAPLFILNNRDAFGSR
jgi:CO dehydrogenase/acetyl-CoA synthase gamma subunit (corrinoid Fe-S protein)